MTIQRRLRVTLLTALCLAMCLCTTAFADTDGTCLLYTSDAADD